MFFDKSYSRGESISIKNKILILSTLVILVFMISAVSANNETEVMISEDNTVNEVVSQDNSLNDSTEGLPDSNPAPIKTTIVSEDKTLIKGEDFTVKLSDENGVGIANKEVQFNVSNNVYNKTTDDNGVAKLQMDLNPGNYVVKYSFDQEGYVKSEGSTNLSVNLPLTSQIKASSYTAYIGVKNTYSVVLTAGGVPLAGKTITFKFNGKTYTRTTDSKGKATLNINLNKKGIYTLSYSYAGEKNVSSASGSVKIKIKKGMPTKITKANSVVYTQNKAGYFKVKLTNSRGAVLKNKKITFKIKGKTYKKKTNSKGIATLKIKLASGSYKLKVSFAKTSAYKKSTKTYKVKVKGKHMSENGMWLFGRDMKSVNLKTLQKNGFKHVFLNFKALELYGKSGVEKWIKSAKSHGIKVHIWMQVFYEGSWYNPVKNPGIINKKVKEAVSYAKIKGVGGVHFDYVRFPGSASKYKGSVDAVNTFVKKATTQIHKVNKNIIVSAALMPEPSSMKSAYAQDVVTMGKYLDVLVPMVYKGNYGAGSKWIKSVTSTFAKQSKKAQIWTGLQSYRSDSSVTKLSVKELKGDIKAAASGGAKGVMLFRFGLFGKINFNEV